MSFLFRYPSTDSALPTTLNESTFICEICMEIKSHQSDHSFGTDACAYLLCSNCMAMYPGINNTSSDIEDKISQDMRQAVDACSAFLEKSTISNSNSLTFICEICLETKSQYDSYSIKACTYSYCSDCMAMYPGIKRDEEKLKIEDEIEDWTFVWTKTVRLALKVAAMSIVQIVCVYM